MIKEKGYLSFLSYLPKILLAVVIPILDSIYNEIAIWLNDKGKLKNLFDSQHLSTYLFHVSAMHYTIHIAGIGNLDH